MNIRPRQDWQDPAQPVVGPAMVLATVDLVPAHYTAAATIPDDIPAYLRAIQNDYTVNRGYSIGYSFAIDQTGQAWECRGFDIKCAANKGMNEVTIAVLCLVDGADPLNPAMADTFRQLAAEAQRVTGTGLLVVGHRDIGSTACPGDGIYHQVVTGQLDPADTPAPTPTPPPTEEDAMSTFILRNSADGSVVLLAYDGAGVTATPLAFDDLTTYQARFGPWLDTHPDVYAAFLAQANG